MRTLKILSITLILFFLISCNKTKKEDFNTDENYTYAMAETSSKGASIYERLGGEEGISSIVDQILETHMKNPILKDIFLPLKNDPEHFEQIKKHSKEFLAAGTGGSVEYTGKDLPTAHKGLHTTEKQYIAVVDDILIVLDEHQIDEETKKDMLFILYSLKDQIIGM